MNEKRLTFAEFVAEVKKSIKDFLPERFSEASVHAEQFQKFNTSYLGLQVKTEDQMVVPNINLNRMYAQYQEEGLTMAAMLTMIAEQVQMAPDLRTEWLKDYSQVKDHLFIRLSDVKENEAFLRTAPHKEVDGLAISYHIAFLGLHKVEASTPVTNEMMKMYGVTAEQLHADALESAQRLFPVQFESMAEVMRRMMGIDPDMAADMLPPAESPQLMVLTNTHGAHGASALFYPGQLDAIAEQIGSDFFVLPSSIHETLILPDDGSMEPDSLQLMVREVNQSTVAPEDRLSDYVYHYDAQDHVLERAETFADRMAEKEQAARENAEKASSRKERKTTRDAEKAEIGDRKERKSVLGRLNDKKEQVKGQPKKSGPNRSQEASI